MAQSVPVYGYWNFRGGFRGQVGRYLLAYAGVTIEDKRYDMAQNKAEWTEQDKTGLGIEFANLPYLIDGDYKLTECKAIHAYICERWCPALLGSSAEERAHIIMMQQVLCDTMMSWLVMCFGTTDRAAVIEKACTSFAPLAAHLGDKNFMQGNDVTMVDFIMFDLVETIEALCEDDRLLQQYSNLTPYMARMKALPNFG